MPAPPLVSVAIPLYRSKEFLPIIIGNIDVIADPNVEILVSDRHGDDDALDILRDRYAHDPRVRLLTGRDRLHWVEHYNLLLREARGAYFMWMPHDDSFPAHYIPSLVAALEEDPAAVLAFGAVDAVDLRGAPIPGWTFHPPPFARARWAGVGDSIRLLFWGSAIPFRGVFRRECATRRGLYLRRHAPAADGDWTFALSLVGALRYVPECRCVKRYYPQSISAAPYRIRDVFRDARVLRAYVRECAPRRRDRIAAFAGLVVWQAVRIAGRTMPAFARPSASQVVCNLLPRVLRPGQRRFPLS